MSEFGPETLREVGKKLAQTLDSYDMNEISYTRIADAFAVLDACAASWEADREQLRNSDGVIWCTWCDLPYRGSFDECPMCQWLKLGERIRVLERDYHELIMAVATVNNGESRHDTALRYIIEREQVGHDPLAAIVYPVDLPSVVHEGALDGRNGFWTLGRDSWQFRPTNTPAPEEIGGASPDPSPGGHNDT